MYQYITGNCISIDYVGIYLFDYRNIIELNFYYETDFITY